MRWPFSDSRGNAAINGKVTSTEKQIDLAVQYGANAILTTGDYLLRMVEVARERGYEIGTDLKLTALTNMGDRDILEAAFGLPYVWSHMRVRQTAGALVYTSRRHSTPRGEVDSAVSVRPGAVIEHPDALADFLTARWALFSAHLGRTLYLPNSHQPWALQQAELLDFSDTLLTRAGLPGVANRPPDSVLFSPGVDSVFGKPQTLRKAARPVLG